MSPEQTPIQKFAAELRDVMLDQHEFEWGLFRGIDAVDSTMCRPERDERLQAIILGRAQQNAEFFMRLAHLLDELSESAAIDDKGDEWKCQ